MNELGVGWVARGLYANRWGWHKQTEGHREMLTSGWGRDGANSQGANRQVEGQQTDGGGMNEWEGLSGHKGW